MKVLLIRHHPAQANKKGRYPRARFPMIPLGLAYIAAALRREGIEVQVLDSYASITTIQEFSDILRSSHADLVGITTMTNGLQGAFEAAELSKKYLPAAKVVLGGAHMATYPLETIQKGHFDYGVVGEGEITMVALANALSSGHDPSTIPGLLTKNAPALTSLQKRPRLKDLNQLPHPARELFPNACYKTALGRNPVSYILTSRGCPFNCTFCDHGLWGKQVTFHSPEWVVEEMARCLSLGAKELYIYDETFTLDKKRVLAICSLINKNDLKCSWVASSRVDTVDREMISTLKKAGCRQIRFGVETGSEHHLKKIKKGISLDQVRQTFQICKEQGVETFAYFMFGLPGESREEMEATLQFALELNPDWVNFNILTIKPGTEIFKTLTESGQHPKDYWLGFIDGTVTEKDCYCTSADLTQDNLNAIVQRAFRQFYFRPSFIAQRLKELRSPRHIKGYLRAFGETYLNRFIGVFSNLPHTGE